MVGNRTRVKVVKNKCSAPFRQAEFDIMYGKGISREGSLLDVAVELGFIKKSGAWFTYEGEQLGQGRENVKTFLSENPQLMAEVDDRVRECLAPEGDSRRKALHSILTTFRSPSTASRSLLARSPRRSFRSTPKCSGRPCHSLGDDPERFAPEWGMATSGWKQRAFWFSIVVAPTIPVSLSAAEALGAHGVQRHSRPRARRGGQVRSTARSWHSGNCPATGWRRRWRIRRNSAAMCRSSTCCSPCMSAGAHSWPALPRASRILDLGGTHQGMADGALVHLGYPYPFDAPRRRRPSGRGASCHLSEGIERGHGGVRARPGGVRLPFHGRPQPLRRRVLRSGLQRTIHRARHRVRG